MAAGRGAAGAGDGPGDGAGTSAGAGRLRFRYSKLGKVRFTGHRDVARMWERALRRSGLPVAWSEGFSPRPLLSFGLALPTGAESMGEYVDVTLQAPVKGLDEAGGANPATPVTPVTGPPARRVPGPAPSPMPVTGMTVEADGALPALGRLVSRLLPEGVEVQAVAQVPRGAGSLQQEVSSCGWELEVQGLAAGELATRVEQFLGAPSVIVRRQRKGRTVEDDLRPSVLALVAASGAGGGAGTEEGPGDGHLRAELATRPRGVRPQELLEGLGAGITLVRACRSHQWIECDGARWEPLAIGGEEPGGFVAHAGRRAS